MTDLAYEILVALSNVAPIHRERWIDNRLCRISLNAIADRDGVTKQAIGISVRKVDNHIRDSVEPRVVRADRSVTLLASTCIAEGCERRATLWGSLCQKHYQRWNAHGTFRSRSDRDVRRIAA